MRWLAIGGVLALGLGIGLWWMLRSDDAPAPAAPRPEPKPRETVTPAASSDRPVLPRDHDGSASPTTREYAVGDTVIRDHRTGDQITRTEPPIRHPDRTRQLPPSLTKAISQKVRAVMDDCATAIPRDARDDKARLDGEIVVAIKDHTLSVSRTAVALSNVTGPALDAAKQCIEQRSTGLQTTAAGEQDIDNYKISLSFRLP